jgi:hypothetical protein
MRLLSDDDASLVEASDKEMAAERAKGLAGQFIMDTHTHFLRDDTRLEGFVRKREAVGRMGWNPALAGKPQSLEDLKYDNYFKEMFLDSDTKVALSGLAGGDRPRHRPPQAGLLQGLHHRRQHPQGQEPAPVAHGRREARLSRLREDAEGGAPERVRAQGPVPAVARRALPPSPPLLRRARPGQGREGLAGAQLHLLSRGVSLPRWRQPRRRPHAAAARLRPAGRGRRARQEGHPRGERRAPLPLREAELGGPRDRLAALKAQYDAGSEGRSNLRYGYVAARAEPPALSA